MKKIEKVHISLMILIDVHGRILLCLKNGFWGLLGGHVEESRIKTASREVGEESKLKEIFGKQFVLHHDEQKGEKLYLFDVYAGYHYGTQTPEPLLNEGILELKWFSIDEAKELHLTPVAQKAIEFLSKKSIRSSFSECMHYMQIVMSMASEHGADEPAMNALKANFEKSVRLLKWILSSEVISKEETNRQKTVLFVDDHKEVLKALKDNFERFGYRVFAFSNANEALEALKSFKDSGIEINSLVVDFWISDELDGNKFIKRARNILQNPNILAILISGENVPEDKRDSTELFFTKPILPVRLKEIIESE